MTNRLKMKNQLIYLLSALVSIFGTEVFGQSTNIQFDTITIQTSMNIGVKPHIVLKKDL